MKESAYIPVKRRPKSLKSVKAAEIAPPALPKDLEDKWGAVQACATAFNVLEKGHFPFSYQKAVGMSLAFLQKLHEQSVEDTLMHPDARLIPELKAELDKRKEGKNGKAAQ